MTGHEKMWMSGRGAPAGWPPPCRPDEFKRTLAVALAVLMFLLGITSLEPAHLETMFSGTTTEVKRYVDPLGDEWEVIENCNAAGQRHGLMEVWCNGRIASESWWEYGTWIWSKKYWPSGHLRMHHYENWKFDVICDMYDEEGNLVSRDAPE